MRWIVLLTLFSGTVNAITVTQLMQRYGKSELIKIISIKTNNGVTIYFNGQLKKAHMPSHDYVNAMTIKKDLNSLGLTPDQVEKIFIEKQKEEDKYNQSRNSKDDDYWLKKQDRWNKLDIEAKKEILIKGNQHVSTSKKSVVSSIPTRCTKKWGTNYRMVKYCMDKQQEALGQLQRSGSNAPSEISGQCTKKWGTNYRMVKYCMDKQQEALQLLKNTGVYK